jgi:chloride channel protein, CIC family
MSSRASATWRLLPEILLTGVVSGLVGCAYLFVLKALMHWLWPAHHSWTMQAAILLAVGAAVALGTRWLGAPASVELLVDNIHVRGGPEGLSSLKSLVPLSLLCIASGSPIGPEAPLVQTCGTLGAALGRRRRLASSEIRVLTLTGMAAAFTVLFGAPAGAAVFALELPHPGGLGYGEALVPALIGALLGDSVSALFVGHGLAPLWTLPHAEALAPSDLAWAAGCGAIGAGGALAFVSLHRAIDAALDRLPGGARPMLAAGGLAGLAALSPAALTFGEGQVDGVTVGRVALVALLSAVVAKFVAVVVAVAGRWPGGFIIPLFFIGFTMGRAIHMLIPSVDAAMLMAALAAASCAAVTKTPLGATLVVTGMAGTALWPTTLVASVLAVLLSRRTVMIETQRLAPLGDAS